jgi:hypothetical protein
MDNKSSRVPFLSAEELRAKQGRTMLGGAAAGHRSFCEGGAERASAK